MKQNMGSVDRIVRTVLALVLLALSLSGVIGGTVGIILIVLGGIILLTALVGFCPLYAPFKISTRKTM